MKKPKISLKKARNITTGWIVVTFLLLGVILYLDYLNPYMEQDVTILLCILAAVLVVLLVAGVVFMHLFLRCPCCDRRLSGMVGYKGYKYCPACGKKITL